jgi:hypothetical protein
VEIREDVIADRAKHVGHDPFAPVRLAEPVADVNRPALDVSKLNEPDASGRFSIDYDGEVGGRDFRTGVRDPPGCVIRGIGVRKDLAQVARDVRIVRVANEGFLVATAPFTNKEIADPDFHAVPASLFLLLGSCSGSAETRSRKCELKRALPQKSP